LARIGSLAHYLVECELRGAEPDLRDYTPAQVEAANRSVASWRAWRKGRELRPLLVEESLVSEKYLFGGTLDLYAVIDGRRSLVDLKTSKAIYPEYVVQLAAYRRLLEESGYDVEGQRIIRIGRIEGEGFEDRVIGNWQMGIAWDLFLLLRKVYDLKAELEGRR